MSKSDKKPVKNKLQLIDEVLKSDDDKTISLTVSEFRNLFSTAQLNRGWTKPQLEDFLERVKNLRKLYIFFLLDFLIFSIKLVKNKYLMINRNMS